MNYDMPSLSAMGTAFFVSLVAVGLRGLQHKNVAGDHYRMIALTCYLIVLGDALTVLFVVHQGIWITIPAGTGAAIGMVTTTYLHNLWSRKKTNEAR